MCLEVALQEVSLMVIACSPAPPRAPCLLRRGSGGGKGGRHGALEEQRRASLAESPTLLDVVASPRSEFLLSCRSPFPSASWRSPSAAFFFLDRYPFLSPGRGLVKE
jgi:hypothetical protein